MSAPVFVLGDLDLPLRGRTYLEPDGAHVAVGRGDELAAALEHLRARPDCRGLAVVDPPPRVPPLEILAGRRLFVSGREGALLRTWVAAALQVTEEVEWAESRTLPLARLAEWALPVDAIVLAAGLGTRMGGNKLLLEVDGEPLVLHTLAAAAAGGCRQVVAVLSDPAVEAALGGRFPSRRNPAPESGLSGSIRLGLQALPESTAGALVMLGDQPLVGARTVRALLSAWRREEARPAVAASYDGLSWRPPVLVDRELWPELEQLSGDEGARAIFARRPELLDTVPVPGRPDDVDTAADYARILRLRRPR